MKQILIILIFCSSAAYPQVQLEINYLGEKESTSVELYVYTDFIIHSKETCTQNFSITDAVPKVIQLELDRPSRLLIKSKSRSMKFYVQANNNYRITIMDDSIYIESEDEINKSMDAVEAKIKKYFKENYKIELDDEKNKKKRTLNLLNDFISTVQNHFVGSEYQNQLVKYRLAETESATYFFLGDKNLFRRFESDFIMDEDIQFQNPAYMHFLLDYYFRRLVRHSLRTRKYSGDLTEFEVIKQETATIPDKMIQQLVMINFIHEAFNTSWMKDNSELIQILDSLTEYGLHEQIRHTSANLSERLVSINKNLEVPDFSMTKLSGDEIKLSDFHGKYVLLDFWFVGCAPCKRAIPFKKKLFDEFGDCMEILSINPIDRIDDIINYKSNQDLPWTLITMDKNALMMEKLNILHYPTYYLLDPDGKICILPGSTMRMEDEFKIMADEMRKDCL